MDTYLLNAEHSKNKDQKSETGELLSVIKNTVLSALDNNGQNYVVFAMTFHK